MARHDAKRDGNELDIVRALEESGCKIMRLASIDLLVLRHGVLTLMEVKTPKSRRRLTTTQRRLLREEWPISVVTTVEEALAAVMRPALRGTSDTDILRGLL